MENQTILETNLYSKDWFIEVYPEWSLDFNNIESLKKYIETNISYQYYALILHDKDYYEDGTQKKPHFHIYIKTTKRERPSYLSKRFLIPKNQPQFLQVAKNVNGVLRYLIHKNNPEKYQYDIKQVITNIPDYSEVIESGFSESQILFRLLKDFKEQAQYEYKTLGISYNFQDFVDYCAYNQALDLCIKYCYFIKTYLAI